MQRQQRQATVDWLRARISGGCDSKLQVLLGVLQAQASTGGPTLQQEYVLQQVAVENALSS
jgi:hypothetical protein